MIVDCIDTDASLRARARFATGNSDLLTDAKAYDECARLRSDGKSASAIRAFCEQVTHHISGKLVLHSCDSLVSSYRTSSLSRPYEISLHCD